MTTQSSLCSSAFASGQGLLAQADELFFNERIILIVKSEINHMERIPDEIIVIRPLTSELNADYLDFFDNRAFTDDNPNGPCYCTSPNQEEVQIQKMISEFQSFGVRESLRRYA